MGIPLQTLEGVPEIVETWDSHAVFRETYLALLPPAEREACRLLGRRLYVDRNEAVLLEDLASDESAVRRELRAVVADLVVTAGYLGTIGQDLELAPADQEFQRLAEESASVLYLMADRILTRLPDPSLSPEAA